jgi:hypothetical protein
MRLAPAHSWPLPLISEGALKALLARFDPARLCLERRSQLAVGIEDGANAPQGVSTTQVLRKSDHASSALGVPAARGFMGPSDARPGHPGGFVIISGPSS